MRSRLDGIESAVAPHAQGRRRTHCKFQSVSTRCEKVACLQLHIVQLGSPPLRSGGGEGVELSPKIADLAALPSLRIDDHIETRHDEVARLTPVLPHRAISRHRTSSCHRTSMLRLRIIGFGHRAVRWPALSDRA